MVVCLRWKASQLQENRSVAGAAPLEVSPRVWAGQRFALPTEAEKWQSRCAATLASKSFWETSQIATESLKRV